MVVTVPRRKSCHNHVVLPAPEHQQPHQQPAVLKVDEGANGSGEDDDDDDEEENNTDHDDYPLYNLVICCPPKSGEVSPYKHDDCVQERETKRPRLNCPACLEEFPDKEEAVPDDDNGDGESYSYTTPDHVGRLMKIFAYCMETRQYLIWVRKAILYDDAAERKEEGTTTSNKDKLIWVYRNVFPDPISQHKAEGEKIKTIQAVEKRRRQGVPLMTMRDKYQQAKACMELRIATMNFENIQSRLIRESGGVMNTQRKLKSEVIIR
jgi:hypothetical protein